MSNFPWLQHRLFPQHTSFVSCSSLEPTAAVGQGWVKSSDISAASDGRAQALPKVTHQMHCAFTVPEQPKIIHGLQATSLPLIF